MSKLALFKSNVPEPFQSLFRHMAKPWRADDDWLGSMFKPDLDLMTPSFSRTFDAMARNFGAPKPEAKKIAIQ